MKLGYFITLEGVEGAGKSTAIDFVREWLNNKGIGHVVTREPGGTEIAEHIRKVLLDHYNEVMLPETELLLFFAGRKQHLEEVILPVLHGGKCVLSDRFTDASYAYQGGGRGVAVERIRYLEEWLLSAIKPDLTLLLDIPPVVGLYRIEDRDELDRMEKEGVEFLRRVRLSYLDRFDAEPERYCIIDATRSLDHVKAALWEALDALLARTGARDK